MKPLNTLIGCFIFLIMTLSTYVYTQDYSYHQYTLKDGLVQMQIQCLFQDSRGYIWIGTKGGVSKFNGETFENFRQQNGLLHPYVYNIAEDSKGNIWFAHAKGLTEYDGQHFNVFPLNDTIVPKRIYGMVIDKADNVYINRSNYKNHTIKFDGEKYHIIKDDVNAVYKLPYGIAYQKELDRVLIARKTLGIGQVQGDSIVTFYSQDSISAKIEANQQLNGVKYIETNDRFYNTFLLKADSLHPLWKIDRKTDSLFDIHYENLPKDYYFQKANQLKCIRKVEKRIEVIRDPDFGLAREIIYDKDGTIWIGTEEGLVQFFGKKGFQHYSSAHFQYTWGLIEDKDQTLWIYGLEATIKNYKDNKVVVLKDYLQAEGMHNPTYFYFGGLRDNNDNLLIPMHHDILRYDGKQYSVIESKSESNHINIQLWEDKDNDFIIAGIDGGINILRDYQVIESFGEKEGIHPCSYIISIGKDKNAEYWLGSFQGLSKLNLQTKNVQIYTRENNKLPSDGIMSITKDNRGNMWFGSRNGLLTYDYQKDSIFNISPTLDTDISFVFPIDDHHLMIGATNGLYVLDLARYYKNGKAIYKHFNHRNGYLGVEPTQNTFLKDTKGQIWIASATSVDKFDPQNLDLSISNINTRITYLNRNKIAYNQSKIELPKGKNNLEFRFEGIGFERPLHTQYAYKLEGYDEDWSTWGKEDFAVYSNLGSGNYAFNVKSRMGSYSDVQPTIASIDLKIDLPFWKEPDFYQKALYVVPVILGLLISFFWKTRQNKKLSAKNLQIAFLNKELSHRVKNNLQFITSLMNLQERRLEDAGAKAALNESKNRIQVMSSLHRRLYHRDDANINLGEYLKELANQFQQSYQTAYNDLSVIINVREKIEIDAEAAGKIGLIVNELVMNAIKHAFANQAHPAVKITLSLKGKKEIKLLVKDNGSGISEEIDLHQSKSLGMKLVKNLVEQLKGDLTIKNNNGLQFEFFFKRTNLTT